MSFLSIPIESFRNATRDIHFDVFLKLSEDNFAHIFSKTTGLDYQRLARVHSSDIYIFLIAVAFLELHGHARVRRSKVDADRLQSLAAIERLTCFRIGGTSSEL